MTLTFEQKSGVRRHLDFPVVGLMKNSPAGGTMGSAFTGYRFFQVYGRLEYKMNNLNPDEEARLVGLAYASVVLVGPNPSPGDTIGITLSGGGLVVPVSISATAEAGDTPVQFILRLATAGVSNAALRDVGMVVVAPFGSGPFAENAVPLAEMAIQAKVAFQITSPVGSGALFPQITAQGGLLSPSVSLDGETTIWGYIPILDGLESAFGGSSQLLFAASAGPWKGRANEIGQRLSLYRNWQVRLSRFLEIPIYTGGPESIRHEYASTSRYA